MKHGTLAHAIRNILLAELALSAAFVGTARAQTQPVVSGNPPPTQHAQHAVTSGASGTGNARVKAAVHPSSALAQNLVALAPTGANGDAGGPGGAPAADIPANSPIATLGTISVSGSMADLPPAVSTPVGPNEYVLGKSDFDDALTGNNALALVKDFPGVSYTAVDTYGMDVSAASLFMRGFHQNELGIVFEGVPLNDGSFLSLTGTNVVNVGVPNAVGSVTISPGSAPVSVFSNSDDSGSLVYALANLQDQPSALVSQSYGAHNTIITTLQGQSGRLGAHGPEVLVDLQRVSDDKYQGAGGTQYFLRGDLKAKQEVPSGDVTLFASGSEARVWGYNNISFGMIRNLGWNADIFYPNYAQAYEDALSQNADKSCGVYTCGELTSLIPYDTGQTTSDAIGSLAYHFNLSPNLSGSVQIYNAHSSTFASLADPTTPSATGAPFSEQVQHPRLTRVGGTASVTYVVGNHTLSAGLWLERTHSAADAAWYNEPVLSAGAPLLTIGPYTTYGPAFQIENESLWTTSSRQFYLQDKYALTDNLTLGFGFKGVDFSTTGGGIGNDPGHAPRGTLTARNNFLPHVSAFWSPNSNTDLFADLAETEIGYRVAERGNIGYSASAWTVSDQPTFDAAIKTLSPEKDWNLTLGVAHRFDGVSVTYDVFYSAIKNRLLSAAVGSQFNQINTVGDMPNMHIVGTDLGFTESFLRHFRFYQGVAVARSFYGDNLVVDGTVFPIKGKAQPGYPILSLVSDLSFKADAWQAGLTSTEYLKQPFSYENDIYVHPNFWQVDGYAAYTLPRSGKRPQLRFRVDVSNLFDRNNIGTSTIGGSPFSGDYQTLQRSAPRQALFTVSAKF